MNSFKGDIEGKFSLFADKMAADFKRLDSQFQVLHLDLTQTKRKVESHQNRISDYAVLNAQNNEKFNELQREV